MPQMITCESQLSQEHDVKEFPVAFLFHTFTDPQWKWSTTEWEVFGVYYTVRKWNYYLQGSDIVLHNDHKLLQKLLNDKNANNKVNRWLLELATNITFEWISGLHNMSVDYLSWLVDVKNTPATPPASIKMPVTFTQDGPATCTHRKTCNPANITPPTYVKPTSTTNKVNALPSVMRDHKDTWTLFR